MHKSSSPCCLLTVTGLAKATVPCKPSLGYVARDTPQFTFTTLRALQALHRPSCFHPRVAFASHRDSRPDSDHSERAERQVLRIVRSAFWRKSLSAVMPLRFGARWCAVVRDRDLVIVCAWFFWCDNTGDGEHLGARCDSPDSGHSGSLSASLHPSLAGTSSQTARNVGETKSVAAER